MLKSETAPATSIMRFFVTFSLLFINYQCALTAITQVLKCKGASFEQCSKLYVNHNVYDCIMCSDNELKAEQFQFPNVERVRLNNKIKKLNSNSLTNLKQLKVLDLSENLILRIPNDFFVPAEHLEIFNVSFNNLRNPTTDTFYSLDSLKVLDLSHNRISAINLGVLDEMKNLERLYLNNNVLFAFDLGVLDELPHLDVVDLSHNDIKTIPLGLFDRSRKITHLYLAGNPLYRIRRGTFDSLNDVVEIVLNDCKIAEIQSGVFDENKALTTLDLSQNDITSLTYDFFMNNAKLHRLNVSHNALTFLPRKIFHKTSLQIVDVSYNRLQTVTDSVFNLRTLDEIYLNNNEIYFLDSLTFNAVGNPHTHVDLSYNRLVHLDATIFEYLSNLETFEIVGNPWECKCLLEMQALMRRRYIQYAVENYFDGSRPVCVALMKKCEDAQELTVGNLTMYYNIFTDKDLQKTG